MRCCSFFPAAKQSAIENIKNIRFEFVEAHYSKPIPRHSSAQCQNHYSPGSLLSSHLKKVDMKGPVDVFFFVVVVAVDIETLCFVCDTGSGRLGLLTHQV